MYDRDTGELTSIASLDSGYLYYDWLDSNRILFTAQDEQKSPNIMSFNLMNHQLDEYKSNASNPSLSYNKKYIAYQQSTETNVVHIDSIAGDDRSMIRVDTQGVLPYKPSPDGKYLLTNMYTNSISDVQLGRSIWIGSCRRAYCGLMKTFFRYGCRPGRGFLGVQSTGVIINILNFHNCINISENKINSSLSIIG